MEYEGFHDAELADHSTTSFDVVGDWVALLSRLGLPGSIWMEYIATRNLPLSTTFENFTSNAFNNFTVSLDSSRTACSSALVRYRRPGLISRTGRRRRPGPTRLQIHAVP
ncbi:uncharacterized protein LOC134217617 [Armigeres subalbatus]|uniref:uncharacterized protein LOC134217617 n=1 Tax=Armigeres subalbatus TaxID=124917 RepID=UPI002ED5EF3D